MCPPLRAHTWVRPYVQPVDFGRRISLIPSSPANRHGAGKKSVTISQAASLAFRLRGIYIDK